MEKRKKGEMGGKNEEKGGKETQQNLPFYLIVHQHEVVNDMYEKNFKCYLNKMSPQM